MDKVVGTIQRLVQKFNQRQLKGNISMPNQATVTLTKNPNAPLPAVNAAFKKTTITVTDGASAVQTADVDGTTESPPWTAVFNNVATGNCTASAQDFDVNGTPIGSAVSTPFTEAGSPPPPATFPQTTGISVAVA
jgi:hypothetical protein